MHTDSGPETTDVAGMSRREFVRASLVAVAAVSTAHELLAQRTPVDAPIKMTVYKSASCGCCKEWVTHVEKNGFTPTVHDLPDAALASTKKTIGIPDKLQSCHTAVVGAYWIEGHVPADLIQKLLTDKPALLGLAAPGMPQGSPGMEMGTKEAYDVIALDKTGKTRVYARR
jgi:hypothetical protein